MDPLDTLYYNGGMTVGIPCVFMSLIFFSEHCTNQHLNLYYDCCQIKIRAIRKSFNQFEPSFVTDSLLITLADFLVVLIS